jgi:hypothetical protein
MFRFQHLQHIPIGTYGKGARLRFSHFNVIFLDSCPARARFRGPRQLAQVSLGFGFCFLAGGLFLAAGLALNL